MQKKRRVLKKGKIVITRKGFKLNNHWLFNKKEKKITGKTEKEIYHFLGRLWKPPEER